MTHDEPIVREQNDKTAAQRWLLPFVAGLAVYVLSVGPALSFSARGTGQTAIGSLYAPVFFVARNIPPFDAALHWYIGQWGYDTWCGTK